MNRLEINRAPVLTLWAVIVARRLGFRKDEALTFGKALAGVTAHTKGIRLGIFEPTPDKIKKARIKAGDEASAFPVGFMGRELMAITTEDGIRAMSKDRPINPESVEKYLTSKFGENLAEVTDAMQKLADSRPPSKLANQAFSLYMQFRPDVPQGSKGWGSNGTLSLSLVRELANQYQA